MEKYTASPFDFDVTKMDFRQLAALRDAFTSMRAICAATSAQPRCIARQSVYGIVDHTEAGDILVEIEEACDTALRQIESEAWRRGYHDGAHDAGMQFEIAMSDILWEGPNVAAEKMKRFFGKAAEPPMGAAAAQET